MRGLCPVAIVARTNGARWRPPGYLQDQEWVEAPISLDLSGSSPHIAASTGRGLPGGGEWKARLVAKFHIGDLVVLKSGSMRMCVEDVAEDGTVNTVWCNEGVIGRDVFNPALLNKWEVREDGHRGGGDRGERGGGHRGGGKPYGGDREGGGKRYGGDRDRDGGRGGRDREYDDRPRKSGWDGKPRDKKFYRND